MRTAGHPREIELRRIFAGESVPEAASHLEGCAECKARVKGFDDEQRKFEAEIPFERFAAGVERASRHGRVTSGRPTFSPARLAMAMAAALLVLAAVPLVMNFGEEAGFNRTKGGATGIEMTVAGPNGPQRGASEDPLVPELLAHGERVRIGYRAGGYHYLTAVAIDEKGEVTALYPLSGKSLPVNSTRTTEYLSESLEFFGQGMERVVVVMTSEPIDVEEVKRAAKARYDEARGNLSQMGTLDLPGAQFHRMFLKP